MIAITIPEIRVWPAWCARSCCRHVRALCRGGDLGGLVAAEDHVAAFDADTIAPLIVQGTYVCASAILTEAILSFLGAGISPETPTWGNIMAEGRQYFHSSRR